MIKETLTESQFVDALKGDEYASWSYGACVALYEYLEQYSEDIGEDIEMDIVAIRCEWSEYDTCLEYAKQHDADLLQLNIDWLDASEAEDEDLIEEKAREWLEENTTVLEAESPKCDESNGYKLGRVTSYVIHEF